MSEFRRRQMMAAGIPSIKPIQIYRNGDFANGVSDWVQYNASNGSLSASDGELTYTVISPKNNQYGNKIKNSNLQNIGVKAGRVYYCSAYIWMPMSGSVSFFYEAGGKESITASAGWNRYQRIYTYSSDHTSNLIGVNSMSGWSVGDKYILKNVVLIDLTQTFGAGNEPDLSTCVLLFPDDYYEYYIPNGYNQ